MSTPAAPAPPSAYARAYRIAALGMTATIVAFCLLPAPTPPGPPGIPIDKLGHFGAFALAAFLWYRGGLGARGTLLLLAGLALATEAAQGLWLAERSAEWADLLADMLGAAFGVWCAARLWAAVRRWIARVVYGGRAGRALAAARSDLARLALPEALEIRERVPVAARRRPLALRGLASAMAQQQRREGDATPCLARTLALLGEARAHGYAPRLVLGVRAPDEAFGAHAWLELDGAPFLEPAHSLERFNALPPVLPAAASRAHPPPG